MIWSQNKRKMAEQRRSVGECLDQDGPSLPQLSAHSLVFGWQSMPALISAITAKSPYAAFF